MRLPRRVPWASLAELDQVCSWIYANEVDLDTKFFAIHRLSAWRAITPLPHALESTLSLLTVILQDRQSQSSSTSATSYLHLRQSYATALVRLVNGLVDPLQLGAYARSITSIATQIGLPVWLVDLRHAATHEDLPSLELLRSGAGESMSWLLHNYFLPTISPSTTPDVPDITSHLTPLAPLLKRYKSLLKITAKDASLRSRYKPEITKLLRDVERWVGEAKVAASAIVFSGWGSGAGGSGDDERNAEEHDARERWALGILCDALLSRGGLVPISAKKRTTLPAKLGPADAPVAIWLPLLTALRAHHPDFPSVLVARITAFLLARPVSGGTHDASGSRRDLSYDMCLGCLAVWIIDMWGRDERTPDGDNGVDLLRRDDVVVTLISGLSSSDGEHISERKAAKALLEALCQDHSYLQEAADTLLSIAKSQRTQAAHSDADTIVMEKRLNALLSAADSPLMDIGQQNETAVNGGVPQDAVLAPGWSLIGDSSAWKACPIGVYSSE